MINNSDINKTVVSNKVSFSKKGFKYYIGYKNGKRVRRLCILLPKISAYRRDFDETKYMSFLIKDMSFLIKYVELLEKYNEIWKKRHTSNSIKKGLDS